MTEGLVSRPSQVSAIDTLARLLVTLARRGVSIIARIDHAAAAASAGLQMPASTVVIFGDPHAGTPLMQKAPTIAIDLPLRVLVWDDVLGATWLSYVEPSWLGYRHGLGVQTCPTIERMTRLLAAVADEATTVDRA